MNPFPSPLLEATLIKRYKRFLADVRLPDGSEITVHCANSGTMKSCAEPGRPVLLSDSNNPKRKLRYTWEMIDMGAGWVGVHSALANRLVHDAIVGQSIPELSSYADIRREVKYGREGRSRVDLVLDDPARASCYVEVKHATMRVDDAVAFPDAVTTRGRKHLEDLMEVVEQGGRAVIFFSVGRGDCGRFRPADEIDPAYGATLREAVAAGVEALAYRFEFGREGVRLGGRLPIEL